MNKQDLVNLVKETMEEVVNEVLTGRSLQKGKKYDWTMGAGPNTITYIGIRRDFPDIKTGSSVGKGFIFQWEDGKYLEIGPVTLGQYVEEIEDQDEPAKDNGYVEDPHEQSIEEISMGLAQKASNAAYNKANDSDNFDPLDSRKALAQARTFKTYINPELSNELEKIGVDFRKEYDYIILKIPNKFNSSEGDLEINVRSDKYKITGGDTNDIDPSLLRRVSVIIKKLQADMKTQKPPDELEESKGDKLSDYNREVENFLMKDATLTTEVSLPAKILKVPFEKFKQALNDEKFIKSLMPYVKIIEDELEESKRTYEEGYKDAKAKFQKLAKAYKKLKENYSPGGMSSSTVSEPRFAFTPELEQKVLSLGYIKKSHSSDLFYYVNSAGDRFYIEGGKTIHGSNNTTRDFLEKNAKQLSEAKIGDELDDDKHLGAKLTGDVKLDKITNIIAKAIDYPAEKTIQLLRKIVAKIDSLQKEGQLDEHHYEIDYKNSGSEEEKEEKAINDLKYYVGDATFEKLKELLKDIKNDMSARFALSFAGIQGYPATVFIKRYTKVDPEDPKASNDGDDEGSPEELSVSPAGEIHESKKPVPKSIKKPENKKTGNKKK